MIPDTTRHLFTANEQARIHACSDALRRSHRHPNDPAGEPTPLAIPLPAPPVDAKGAPIHDRDVLGKYTADYEVAAQLNAQYDAAQAKIDDLRALVRRATASDPAGLGQLIPGRLSQALRSLPQQADYPTPAAWLTAYVPAVDKMTESLTALVREGFRAP
jgi:hypothetical protein